MCIRDSFYLFGIDLGAREIENHHAKGSAYESGEVLYEEKLNTPSRANFGGKNILSMNVLLWSKDLLEDAVFMRRFGRRYYNCSDGVRIARIIPILSDTIKLNPRSGKLEYIEAVSYTHLTLPTKRIV